MGLIQSFVMLEEYVRSVKEFLHCALVCQKTRFGSEPVMVSDTPTLLYTSVKGSAPKGLMSSRSQGEFLYARTYILPTDGLQKPFEALQWLFSG